MKFRSQSLDLGASFIERARTIDGVSGTLQFLFEGKLRANAAAGFGFAHATGAKALELLLRRAPGDDKAVELCSHAGFNEQGSFDENSQVSAAFLPVVKLIENNLVNARVKDGIELREFRGIGEDDGGESVAVDASGRIGEIDAESLKDFVVSGLPRFHKFVGNGIGIENGETELAKNSGDNAFAAADAASEAEFQH